MTHTPLSKFLNLCAAFALVAGSGTVVNQTALYASVSGVGSSTVNIGNLPGAAELRPAADTAIVSAYQTVDAGIQLIIGILLILLGFFLHGFARARDERPVPIRIASRQDGHAGVVPPKTNYRSIIYWMEMKF